MIVCAVAAFVVTICFPAPYGRYDKKGWGMMVPSRLAWIIMEIPNLIVVAIFVLYGKQECLQSLANRILLMCFVSG
jgi:ABC-type dipeptide/oligopeptide/nickel transport system permease subunit